MNKLAYWDIAVGQTASFEKTITPDDMEKFCEITGDNNPLHANSSNAIKSGFRDRVVYGMLTGSLLSTLAGMHLPGLRSLMLSVNISFNKPCYIGDRLMVHGEVIDKKDFAKTLKIRFAISTKETVAKGDMLVMVREDG